MANDRETLTEKQHSLEPRLNRTSDGRTQIKVMEPSQGQEKLGAFRTAEGKLTQPHQTGKFMWLMFCTPGY